MQCHWPEYNIAWTQDTIRACLDIARRMMNEVGLKVEHDQFASQVATHDGVRRQGDRLFLDPDLYDSYMQEYIDQQKDRLGGASSGNVDQPWTIRCGGYSIAVRDIDTDQVREATSSDLRELIRLCHSLDIGGGYPCTPQDVPPLMRPLACFKICWQESDRIRPFDYLDRRQLPYLHDMYRVMDKPLIINVNIPEPMTVSHEDIQTVLDYYPTWKQDPSQISWYSLCDYAMLGITKPITAAGCAATYLAQSFGAYMLFRLYDDQLHIVPRLSAGMPVDLQQMNWAFGSPRQHLYDYLNTGILAALCGVPRSSHKSASAFMSTGSCAVDARAGMEKMSTSLVAALQGARSFAGAGNLAVDDLFSGVQLLLDVEIFNYVRELVESFNPSPDIMTTDGLFDLLREVGLGKDEFYSHPDTATKIRTLLPVSPRRPHEKLRAWMMHTRNMHDILRDECRQRINDQPTFQLDDDRHRALDDIYNRAQKDLYE